MSSIETELMWRLSLHGNTIALQLDQMKQQSRKQVALLWQRDRATRACQ